MKNTIEHDNKKLWFTQLGKRRNFAFNPTNKESQPNLQSRIGRNTWILFVDFDSLPEGFDTYEGLGLYLESLGMGVITTMSGKKKGLIFATGSSMSHGKAYDTIEKVIGHELASTIDRHGMLHSFVHPIQFQVIESYLATARPVEVVEDRSFWNMRKFNLSSLPGMKELSKGELKVVEFMLSNSASSMVMDLPQKFISENTGLSVSTVSRAIKSMVETGILKLVDGKFLVGVKAKTYEMINASLRAVLAARTVLTTGNCFHREPPQTIEDGTWFQTIWNCTWLFDSTVAFCNWIDSLDGILFKGRRKRALKSWEAHIIRQGGIA